VSDWGLAEWSSERPNEGNQESKCDSHSGSGKDRVKERDRGKMKQRMWVYRREKMTIRVFEWSSSRQVHLSCGHEAETHGPLSRNSSIIL